MRTLSGHGRRLLIYWLGGGTLLLAGLLLGWLLVLPVYRGCIRGDSSAEKQKKEAAEKKKKEKEKPKEDFESGITRTEPFDSQGGWTCKPGHWTGFAWEKLKANHFDYLGEMELKVVDKKMQPVPLGAAPFELSVARQAVLPKGQTKNLTSVFYVPPDVRDIRLQGHIGSAGGAPYFASPLPRMPSYQYHFVVLARYCEQYRYLNNLSTICPVPRKEKEDSSETVPPFYRVWLLSGEKPPPLPDHAAEWTSIAYVLWDDARPTVFPSELQNALLDWLHWGGVLILSGPTSLDGLRGSFLEPYLPAVSAGARELGADSLEPLSAFGPAPRPPLKMVKPWSGVKLQKDPQATWVPQTGELLAERRVGRGRIIVTAFRLTEKEFTHWTGKDQFFNAFLLRRQPRWFDEDSGIAYWADRSELRDAARASPLRFFARDEGLQLTDYATDLKPLRGPVEPIVVNSETESEEETLGERRGPGVAAWNDFSRVASAARKNITSAARVEVPDKSFVIWILTMYLAVLVPLNWSIFKTLGRVEWAWIAAPLIALACTGLVIKLAQLDIGFVRSRTEIAVLEIQGEYPRAHLTRYNALYTSLTTSYDFRFDDGGAVALPFPREKRPENVLYGSDRSLRTLRYRPGDQAVLSGLFTLSNSTSLIHSEEMFELGGKLALSTTPHQVTQIVNKTSLTLHGAGIIKKMASGNLRVAWVGTLEPGTVCSLIWIPKSSARDAGSLWRKQRDEFPLSADRKSQDLQGELNIRPLLDLAQLTSGLRPGDVRLVAWTDKELPGMKVTPQSPQGRYATLVIAHLAYGESPAPQPDANTAGPPIPSPDHPEDSGFGMQDLEKDMVKNDPGSETPVSEQQ